MIFSSDGGRIILSSEYASFSVFSSFLIGVTSSIIENGSRLAICLGHKQTKEDPWSNYESTYIVGNDFEGVVKDVFAKGAIVNLDDDIEAFCPLRYTDKDDGSRIEVGESLKFRVLEFSKENRRILVSHTTTFQEKESKDMKESKRVTEDAVEDIQSNQQSSTLGDIDDLSVIKENLEENDKKKENKS